MDSLVHGTVVEYVLTKEDAKMIASKGIKPGSCIPMTVTKVSPGELNINGIIVQGKKLYEMLAVSFSGKVKGKYPERTWHYKV